MKARNVASRALKLSNYAAQFLSIGLSSAGISKFPDNKDYATGGMDVFDSLLFKRPDYFANPYILYDIDSSSVDEFGIRNNGEIEKWINNSKRPSSNEETQKYFRLRRIKKFARPATTLAFTPATVHTAGISVPDLALNTSSAVNTGVHLTKLNSINHEFNTSGIAGGYDEKTALLLNKNMNYLMKIKKNKAVTSGINLAFSAIPAGQIAGTAAQIVSGLTAAKSAFSKIISKSIHGEVEDRDLIQVAIALHYLAYKEQTTGSGMQKPATMVFNEVFTQRGFSRVIHKYNSDALISEPCGWLALADKLSL